MKKYVVPMVLVVLAVCLVCAFPSSQGEDGYILTADTDHGTLTDSTGAVFTSGEIGEGITLTYEPNRGYEFLNWKVDGDCTYTYNGNTITFSELRKDVTLSVETRYYSTSQELINIVDVDGLPVGGDTLVNSWSIKSENLDMTGNMWKGMPCTPLIVDETVYVRAGGMLYAVDINTGTILHSVRSQGLAVDYYHYLSYGNGVIFDTTGYKAYDLELNYLYDLPSDLRFVTYHDGYFFGCCLVTENNTDYYTMFKTTLDKDSYVVDGTKVNMLKTTDKFRLFAQYGQFGNVMVIGDWFFFLEADKITGTSGYRALTAFNIKTEEHTTVELKDLTGMPWDDGWLTYYNGYFYVTAYTAGLFDGVIKGLEDKRSTVAWVRFDFDKGEFGEPRSEFLSDTAGNTFVGIASGLVIYKGRGYVNVRALGTDTLGGSDDKGTLMLAYDIQADGTPVPSGSAESLMTHGGIVVNIAHEDEGKVYIYMIPYNSMSQGVYVFTDTYEDGKWTLNPKYDRLSPTRYDWCSQAIRAGPNGEMVYYVDSGYLDCYVKASSFDVTVILDSGENGEVKTAAGTDMKTAISYLYPGAVFDGGTVTIGGRTYDCYGLNIPSLEVYSWEKIKDVSNSKFSGSDVSAVIEGKYKYVILLESGADNLFSSWTDVNRWYYFDGSGYSKCLLADTDSIDSASGKTIVYSASPPAVDSSDIWPDRPSSVSVNREGSTEVGLPYGDYTFSFEVSIASAVSVSRSGTVMTVTGLEEMSVILDVILNGKIYPLTVLVLPKVTVDGDTTITESDSKSQDTAGNTVHTIYRTEADSDGSVTDLTATTTAPDGSVVSVRKVDTKVLNVGDYEDRLPVKTENTEDVLTDPSGTVVSNVSSEKRTVVREGVGYTETDVLESVLDNISKTQITTRTVTTVYLSSVVISVTKTDSEGKVSESSVAAEAKSGESSATVPSAVLNGVDTLQITVGDSEIVLGTEAVSNLRDKGDVTFSVTEASGLSGKVKRAAGDATVFSVDLSCGGTAQSQFGAFTLYLPFAQEMRDGMELNVWRIGDDGSKTYMENVTVSDGKVSFVSDHLSLYAVGYEKERSYGESDSTDNTILYACVAIIAILVLAGAVFLLKKRSNKV